jgi:hypothetical protein
MKHIRKIFLLFSIPFIYYFFNWCIDNNRQELLLLIIIVVVLDGCIILESIANLIHKELNKLNK